MNVIREKKDKNFAVMSVYHLKDKRLSVSAKFIMCQLLALPPNWILTYSGLAACANVSEETVKAAFKELVTFGYMSINEVLNDDGTYKHTDFTVYERSRADAAYAPKEEKEAPPKTASPEEAAALREKPCEGNADSVFPGSEPSVGMSMKKLPPKPRSIEDMRAAIAKMTGGTVAELTRESASGAREKEADEDRPFFENQVLTTAPAEYTEMSVEIPSPDEPSDTSEKDDGGKTSYRTRPPMELPDKKDRNPFGTMTMTVKDAINFNMLLHRHFSKAANLQSVVYILCSHILGDASEYDFHGRKVHGDAVRARLRFTVYTHVDGFLRALEGKINLYHYENDVVEYFFNAATASYKEP